MNARSPRRWAAIAVLLVSCAALLATSPGPPTEAAEAGGELEVGPGDAGHVEARFAVADPGDNTVARVSVEAVVETWVDRRVSAVASAAIAGTNPIPFGLGRQELDPEACRGGCQIDVSITARWIGPEEPTLRTRWSVEVAVEFAYQPSDDAVRLDAVVGDESSLPRSTWPALGALLALTLAAGLMWMGPRAAPMQLGLAAGLVVLGAYGTVATNPGLWLSFGGRIVRWELVATLAASLCLGTAAAVGVWRAARGRPTALRVVGWLAVIAGGFALWLAVEAMDTYRPHEVVALAAIIMVPSAAAVTATSPLQNAGEHGRGADTAMALVIACQILMFGAAVLLAGWLTVLLVASLLGPGARLPDLGSLAIGAIPVVVAVEYAFALLAWRRGRRGPLLVANLAIAIAVIPAGGWALVYPDGGFFVITLELRAFAAVAIAVVLVGTIGPWLLRPPTAGEEGQGQRKQGHEVPRIPDEDDRRRMGDIA
jgi:hypothetical protein